MIFSSCVVSDKQVIRPCQDKTTLATRVIDLHEWRYLLAWRKQ